MNKHNLLCSKSHYQKSGILLQEYFLNKCKVSAREFLVLNIEEILIAGARTFKKPYNKSRQEALFTFRQT